MRKLSHMLIAMMMAAVLAVTLAACGGGVDDTTGTPTEAPAAKTEAPAAETAAPSGDTGEPAAQEPGGPEYSQGKGNPITLGVYMNNSGFDQSTWGKDIVSMKIIEETGVNLEFEIAAADDNQKLNLLISSNTLPDLVFTTREGAATNNAPAVAMIDGDIVYSLDELMAQYAPSMASWPLFTENRKFLEYRKTGKIYTMPAEFTDRSTFGDGIFIMPGTGYYIRDDLLQAVGNPPLKTLDDLEEALKLVKDYDASITHPLLLWGAGSDPTGGGIQVLYQSMGGKGPYYEKDGMLYSKARDPLWKDTMVYVNGLYNQGLINVAEFTDTNQQQEVNNSAGNYFAAAGAYWRAIVPHDELPNIIPGASIAAIDPLLQPGIDEYFSAVTGLNGWAGFYVTKTTKAPDRCTWFLQYIYSDEGQCLVTAGIEGEHWEMQGPNENWITPIGEAKGWMDDNWSTWVENLGTYKYVWGARNYYDSSFCWGLAIDDDFKRDVYTKENVGKDYSAYEDIDPDPSSTEGANLVKFRDMYKNATAKMCLAKDAAEIDKLYDEFIADADRLGLPAIEQIWTDNYKTKNGL